MVVPYISLCKTCDPKDSPFSAYGNEFKTLNRGLLDGVT